MMKALPDLTLEVMFSFN